MRTLLLDSFSWMTPHFVHESRSIGQFHLIEPPFCPRESFYWTVSLGWGSILSTRAVLLDSFTWLRLHFVRESRSIGQFHLVEPPFCPREPLYWTVFAGWLLILSMRAVLLDSFCWSAAHFVHESRSIGQFLQIASSFCPWEPFYWTVFPEWLLILSTRAVLLDSFCRLPPHFVHERLSIGQFHLIEPPFCPREPFYWTIFADCLLILSTRGVLLDSFSWMTPHFVHDSRSIGHFLQIASSFCPWEPFYWTVFPEWLLILSTRAVLLDSFSWLSLHFVRESRSIGQFLLVGSSFCPWAPFYWTVSTGRLLILSMSAARILFYWTAYFPITQLVFSIKFP